MKLKHIEAFHAVMVAGSVSGAARLLNVTQPAVTTTLQHAEMQLGFPLFKRKKHRLIPTREARELYPEIEKLFGQLETVRRISASLSQGRSAELKILVAPSLAVQALPEALKAFRKRHARTQISIRTLHSRDIAQAIALREADIGFIYGSQPHPSLEESIIAEGYLVCVSQNELDKTSALDEIDITDLSNQSVIRLYERDPIGSVLSDLCSRQDIRFSGGMTVQTYHTALTLAEHGFGIAIVDNFTASGATTPSLNILRLTPQVRIPITALTNLADENSTTLQQVMIDSFAEALLRLTGRSQNHTRTKP
jgi:DNA-binding transcriptional LysR family regulator